MAVRVAILDMVRNRRKNGEKGSRDGLTGIATQLEPNDMDALDIAAPNEIEIFNEANPRALVHLLPEPVLKQLRYFTSPNYPKRPLFRMWEPELYATLRKAERSPSATDNRLRVKFWIEYDRVQSEQSPRMVMANVIGNTISRELFYREYITRAERLAWMLCPPIDYIARGEEALCFGITRLREMIEMPIANKSGALVPGAAQVILQIVKFLDERIYGALPVREPNRERAKITGAMRRGKQGPVKTIKDENAVVEKSAESMTVAEAHRKLRELEKEEMKLGIYNGPGHVPIGEEE